MAPAAAGWRWRGSQRSHPPPPHHWNPPPPTHTQKLPRVDVGSLEEVLGRMEADKRGEWDDVVFVPAQSVAAPATPQGKAGKKKK